MANIKLPPGEWHLEFPEVPGFERNFRILPHVGSQLVPIDNALSVRVTNTQTGRTVTMMPGQEMLPNGQIRTFSDGPQSVGAGGGGTEGRGGGDRNGGGGGGGSIRRVGPFPSGRRIGEVRIREAPR